MKKLIYLDYNATSPILPDLAEALAQIVTTWGNPSSIHWAGQAAKTVVRTSRQNIAKALNVSPLELVFTSGGSESNNTVLKSTFFKTKGSSRNEFITTEIEHSSVLNTFQWIESQGGVVHYLKVNREGEIDLAQFQEVLSEKTALVSVMLANNETGVLFPIKKISEMAHSFGAEMHTDAVQAYGKIPVNLASLDVDFASIASHKFYGLKGTGVLFCKKGHEITPLIHGGGQERHRRGGTEGTLGIYAMGFMADKIGEVPDQATRLGKIRDHLEKKLLELIPETILTQQLKERLPNTTNFILPGLDGETLLMSLDVKGFAVSTGAACSSGSPEPSPTLLKMGLTRDEAQSSMRVSLGWLTTEEDAQEFLNALVAVVKRLKGLSAQSTQEVL